MILSPYTSHLASRGAILALGVSCLYLPESVSAFPFRVDLKAQTERRLISASATLSDSQAVEDFGVSSVSGAAGEQIGLNIVSNPDASPEDVFTITGLPGDAKLSAGKLFEDMWLVRRKDLAGLTVFLPAGFMGNLQVMVTRARAGARAPLALNMTVNVFDKSEGAASPSPRGLSYTRSQGDDALYNKAYQQFKKGDVSGARAMFEYLALKGDAQAAIAMGETYDPVVLGQLYIKGLQPDESKAVGWYRKADELGDSKAKTRLNALNQR